MRERTSSASYSSSFRVQKSLLLLILVLPLVQTTRPRRLQTPQHGKQDIDFRPPKPRRLATNVTLASSEGGLGLASNISTTCSICRDGELLVDYVPVYEPSEESPPNLTCGQWEQIARSQVPLERCEADGIRDLYSQCCISHVPLYQCEGNIRQKILQDYDVAVPPISSAREPLKVTIRMEYRTVISINVPAGTTELFFTILLTWRDPRLAWQVDSDHCADQVAAFASSASPDSSEIWVPDIDLMNQVSGMQSLPESMALVSNNGNVVWKRNGGLTAICSFTGVAKIPFDVLGCQLLVGPRVRANPRFIQYILWNGTGLVYGDFEQTYNEYLPVPELAESGYAFNGAMLYFNLFFRRAQNYYIFNLIVPTIVLTYVSMGTFLLDVRIGERLGFGMALALVVVAQQIATFGMIPISNERLWIDKFIGWSFYWVIIGLLESVFLGYIYFLREDQTSIREIEEERNYPVYKDIGESTLGTMRDHAANGGKQSTCHFVDEVDVDEVIPDHAMSMAAMDAPIILDESYVGDLVESPRERYSRMTLKRRLQKPYQTEQNDSLQFTKTLRSLNQDQSQPEPLPKHAKHWRWVFTMSLRKIDRFFFVLTLVTYSLFVAAMFLSIPYWGAEQPDVWIDENTSIRLTR